MPLKPGNDKKTIQAGKSPKHASVIAYSKAGKSTKINNKKEKVK